MIASVVMDLFAGFGCAVFGLLMAAMAAVLAALRLGLLPGLAARLRQLGKDAPDETRP